MDAIAAKPGRPKSDSKHDAIKTAAACLFMDVGYERTSMDAIAARAGVSKQTVYSHFANKEELFRECIVAKMRTYELDVASTEIDGPIENTLQQIALRLVDLLLDEQVVAVYRLLIAETPAFPRLATTFWETGPAVLHGNIEALLANSTRAGLCNIADPKQAALDFTCLVEADFVKRLLMNHLQAMSAEQKQAHVERCVAQFLRLHDATPMAN
ncbi:MAG: TetR/AcrR family transcriptional regulator [Pseudomonadota bacterium]